MGKTQRDAQKWQMKVRVIGEISAFDQDIQDSVRTLEEFSSQFEELHFQLALNYGSRNEMVRGVKKMLEKCQAGELSPEELTEENFADYLDTAGLPDPDLLIRTSGEQRLSNFLLWQLAYTEFYFTDVHWPDFNQKELVKAIEQYNKRDRRYGGVKEGNNV